MTATPEAPTLTPQNARSAGKQPHISLQAALARRFESDLFSVVATGIIGATLAFVLALVIRPVPTIHDEFCYLMQADTFACGRVTNPTHPHWQHFETYHVLQHPTRTAKYPPAQAAAIAIGQRLGHPIVGVCLSTAISMSALVWMLQGWLPKRSNLFMCLIIASHPGLQVMWGQCYMGGAVAMTAGALLLGAAIRFTRACEIHLAVVAATGISLLVFSRPLEGAVLTATIVAFLVWRAVSLRWPVRRFAMRIVAPMVLTGVVFGSVFLGYNHAVTGDPFHLPYQLYEDTYGWNSTFLWQQARPEPEYRHDIMRTYYEDDLLQTRAKHGTTFALLKSTFAKYVNVFMFFFGCSLALGLRGLPRLWQQKRFRLAVLLMVPTAITVSLNPWGFPHYLAPVAPLFFLLAIGGMLELWDEGRIQSALFQPRTVAVFHGVWLCLLMVIVVKAQSGWPSDRRDVLRELGSTSGNDLVFVRYSAEHNFHAEWVYNRADIDKADVVWAREISPEKDRALIDYFKDRKVWLLEVDRAPVKLEAYPPAKAQT